MTENSNYNPSSNGQMDKLAITLDTLSTINTAPASVALIPEPIKPFHNIFIHISLTLTDLFFSGPTYIRTLTWLP